MLLARRACAATTVIALADGGYAQRAAVPAAAAELRHAGWAAAVVPATANLLAGPWPPEVSRGLLIVIISPGSGRDAHAVGPSG
jgi:hypothetical protein